MVLKHLKKVIIRHVPSSGECRAAREVIAQLSTARARASNPNCEISNRVRASGDRFVEVTYANDTTERIPTDGLTAQNILTQIRAQTAELETKSALEAAGLSGVFLVSTFGLGEKSQKGECGKTSKILPR